MSLAIPPPPPGQQQQRKKYTIAEVFGEDDEDNDADGVPMEDFDQHEDRVHHEAPGIENILSILSSFCGKLFLLC